MTKTLSKYSNIVWYGLDAITRRLHPSCDACIVGEAMVENKNSREWLCRDCFNEAWINSP